MSNVITDILPSIPECKFIRHYIRFVQYNREDFHYKISLCTRMANYSQV